MTDSNFYLGRAYDPNSQTVTNEQVDYDPADLTTHAVVTGMTGSGKTGLCIALLEEAALKGIPAIIIDLKGDLTNLLLHFPDLAPRDFLPWIDAEQARRSGKKEEQVAAETAETWRKGLGEWGLGGQDILNLKNSAQFAVYTPGSDSGIPVSVLSSLAAPEIPWNENREVLREKIASTVTALLGLVGYDDIDPLRSREHMLLSNIFENAWKLGKNVNFKELILQTQTPPFDKIGEFEVSKLFPEKDRMELAMALNSVLVSSAFEPWLAGRPLDIQAMLYGEGDQPQHSIFYLAHLPDNQKMFFVTLLLSAIEMWMRALNGTSALRALVYMDEIYGFLPPVSNPPSKSPLLRMLKQARAFGIGLVLGTQNPADIDYKALSNAGTWFIGKLQTEQDKNRLLDGLVNASGEVSRSEIDGLLSSLGKRVFVLHNVHSKQPVVFQTRWTMNYLAGPQTRNRIDDLNKLTGFNLEPADVVPRVAVALSRGAIKSDTSVTKPFLPAGIKDYFLPNNYNLPKAFEAAGQSMPVDSHMDGFVYRPALIASVQIRILDRKLGVDSEITRIALVETIDKRGVVRWDDNFLNRYSALDNIETSPWPSSRFSTLEAPLNDAKLMSVFEKDFEDWAYRNTSVQARANDALKVYAGPDVSRAEFMRACADAASKKRDAEVAKEAAKFDRQLRTLKDRKSREERELREDESELSHRKWEEAGTHLENIFGGGKRARRRVSTSLSKRRMTEKAKADVEESVDAIEDYEKQIAELEEHREEAIQEINDKWGHVVNDITEVTVTPKKTDVFVNLFGVAWVPYYVVQSGTETIEVPAFGDE